MDKGYKVFGRIKTTLSRRLLQVTSSKAHITARFHKIPTIWLIRFEDQQLISFSELLILLLLFRHIRLKQRFVFLKYKSLRLSLFGLTNWDFRFNHSYGV